MAARPPPALACGLLLAAFVLALLWRTLTPGLPAPRRAGLLAAPRLRDLVGDTMAGLGLQARPPPCASTVPATYAFALRQAEVSQGQPLSVLLTGGTARGGAVLRVELSTDAVALVPAVRDLRNGSYRCDFPPLFIPAGEYTAVAYEMYPCSQPRTP